MAARTAISVVRDIDPKLLLKKDRGRGADVGKEINAYGQVTVMERVPGAELLDHDEALCTEIAKKNDFLKIVLETLLYFSLSISLSLSYKCTQASRLAKPTVIFTGESSMFYS